MLEKKSFSKHYQDILMICSREIKRGKISTTCVKSDMILQK